ncbi:MULTISPECIES: Arc family DNA-binding protein [Acinetobacter]|uniref:Arc family DNA-binding protein n=1 Tax=Acinetobacter TaxID=469 RepID=UPI00344ED5B8
MEFYLMSENLVQLNTRIPTELKERISISVKKNKRSLNGETIFLLAKGLEADGQTTSSNLAHISTESLIEELRKRFGSISITFNK